jgi:hypothetical protein
MGEVVPLKEPKPLVRAAGSSAAITPQEDPVENGSESIDDGIGDSFGESEIERARRLPLAPIRPRT